MLSSHLDFCNSAFSGLLLVVVQIALSATIPSASRDPSGRRPPRAASTEPYTLYSASPFNSPLPLNATFRFHLWLGTEK